MDKHSQKARHEFLKEPLHNISLSNHEMQLIREAVDYYLLHQADEMLIFEYQLILDDIEGIIAEWGVNK